MLRVCGVTFDHTTNYGSCFQAYALQQVIEKQKIDGEQCAYDLLPVSTFPVKRAAAPKGNLVARAKRFAIRAVTKLRRKQFEGFEKQHMHYADCHSREELPKLNQAYDAFVCGSDVVWNFTYIGDNPTYFLDFAEKYRFSYAASFGKTSLNEKQAGEHIPENCEEIVKANLPRLDQISVRENEAKRIAAQYTDKAVEHVCDPVLLLDAEAWDTILPAKEKTKPYIFVYHTSIRPVFSAFVKKIHAQTGLPLAHVVWQASDALKQRTMLFPNPLKWLTLLRDAEYVVTNSFHGTLFAMIFHKKFFSVIQDGRSTRANIRLFELLENMGLESRLFTEVPETIDLGAVDYSEADQRIAGFREKSLNYLRSNLQAACMRKKETGVSECAEK